MCYVVGQLNFSLSIKKYAKAMQEFLNKQKKSKAWIIDLTEFNKLG